MTTSKQRSVLLVEGIDDKSVVLHLLRRHNLGYREEGWPLPPLPIPKASDGVEGVLAVMDVSVRGNTGRSAGFVLDANSQPEGRWAAVASRLREVGVTVPDQVPEGGFVGSSTSFGTRVGVWIMPDNRRTGALEEFLADLVETGDPLFAHAKTATDNAVILGAEFAATATQKAVVHAWLAWQEEPGLRYGTAIRARYFRHDAPAARAFVAWFRRLYDVK